MKKAPTATKVMAATIAVVGLTILVISCATVDRVIVAPPLIPGAKYVGMDTCSVCHEKEVKNFKLTQHARIVIPGDGPRVEGQGCEACHGAGSLHVDSGGDKKLIVSGKDPTACFQCHLDKQAEFSLPHHHPVKEGKMDCTACHNPHGEDIQTTKAMPVARVNDICAQCHREQARPHVFEHEAMREGCITCHDVHGSINPKMLTERDNNLCLKCHAQVAAPNTAGTLFMGGVPHAGFPNGFLERGTCFTAGCHEAVHGSDVNAHLRY